VWQCTVELTRVGNGPRTLSLASWHQFPILGSWTWTAAEHYLLANSLRDQPFGFCPDDRTNRSQLGPNMRKTVWFVMPWSRIWGLSTLGQRDRCNQASLVMGTVTMRLQDLGWGGRQWMEPGSGSPASAIPGARRRRDLRKEAPWGWNQHQDVCCGIVPDNVGDMDAGVSNLPRRHSSGPHPWGERRQWVSLFFRDG